MSFRARIPLLVALVLGGVSCAYYNTFYVAKKSFKTAEDIVARSASNKAPPDAVNNYDVTLEQCRKLLQRHPKSKWADDAVYLMGASYYGKGDYDSALIRLNDLIRIYPKSGMRPDALFLTGMCEIKRHEYALGQTAFDTVLREYPSFQKRDEIYYSMADAASDRRDRATAISGYERIVRDLPKSPKMEDALRRIGEIYFDTGKFDSASVAFGRLLTIARDDHKRADAAVLQAQTLMRLDRGQEALDLVRLTLPKESDQDRGVQGGGEYTGRNEDYSGGAPVNYSASNTPSSADDVPRLRLQEAAALNQLGKSNEAIKTLKGILARYSTSNYAVEAQFQIGYTYETLLDSLDAARSAYEKAAQLPGRSAFKEQAAQRADAVRSFISLEKQAQKENAAEESRAAASLRIAESFLLDRGLVKEATDQYKKVEEEFPASRSAPRAAYALAYIRWKKQADSLGAQQGFRDLVRRYPASSQARSAIKLLANQGADTAGLDRLLQEILPDTLAEAAADTAAGAATSDTTMVGRAPGDSLPEYRATTLRGERPPFPAAGDSAKYGRIYRGRQVPPDRNPNPPDWKMP